MSKLAMVATFRCAEGKGDEMDEVLAKQVEAASALDGVEMYSYHRGEGDQYSFFALFTSQEALESQGESQALQDVMPAFMALLAEPPNMSTYTPVAAFGFDV